jgi:hypothetical protein
MSTDRPTIPLVRRGAMTRREAHAWVHRQLIVDELDCTQLVAVFTALTAHAPDAGDRRDGLFRRCCQIVLLSMPAAPPSDQSPPRPGPERRGSRGIRSVAS